MSQEKRAIKLSNNRLRLAEYKRSHYHIDPEFGTSIADIKNPEYWAHVAAKLKPGDLIDFLAEDNSFFAQVLILEVGGTWAKVHVLAYHDLISDGEIDTPINLEDYTVTWSGRITKFRIIRNSDKAVIKDEFSTKPEAERWLVDYQKALAA